MDKEKFHNQLALNLGFERIVKDKRFNIKIDDKGEDIPNVTIEVVDTPVKIEFKASKSFKEEFYHKQIESLGIDDEIHTIINAVHSAYMESTKELANF